MRIACIGYMSEYNHKDVFDIAFDSKESILEYDLLIIDFETLYTPYKHYEYYKGKGRLSDNDSVRIQEDIRRRKNEILEFLKSGKDIIVILSNKDYRYYYTGKYEYSGTGRNARKTSYVEEVYLTDVIPKFPSTIDSSGSGIQIINKSSNEFFEKYKNCFKYKAYTEDIDDNKKILNIKGTTKTISYYEEYEKGIILFFPQPTFEHLGKSASTKELNFFKDINILLSSIKHNNTMPLPEWTKDYKLPNEQEIINDINDIDMKIEKLRIEKDKTNEQLVKLQNKKRLFTACDTELEEIVKDTFEEIGFSILKFGGNEEDILMEYKKKPFIVEIKGLDKSAAEKNAAQTAKWIANYFAETGKKPKGILIVNAFKNKLLEDRQETFPNQMIKYSAQQEICLLSTMQLLNIYYAIINNPSEKTKIIDSIFKTNGIFNDLIDWKISLYKEGKQEEKAHQLA